MRFEFIAKNDGSKGLPILLVFCLVGLLVGCGSVSIVVFFLLHFSLSSPQLALEIEMASDLNLASCPLVAS